MKKAQADIEEIKLTQRTILSGLKELFHFEQPMIEKSDCRDEVDKEIVQLFLKLVLLVCCPRTWLLSLRGLKLHDTTLAAESCE